MALVVSVLSVWGQGCCADTVTFAGRIENAEYQVWIEMDFYHNDVVTPGQEIFGQVPGYFGAKRDTRKWIFVDAEVKGKQARLVITNDYGSEDLEARLTLERDGTYTLERLKGSTMKIVVGGKWVNIPKKLTFKRLSPPSPQHRQRRGWQSKNNRRQRSEWRNRNSRRRRSGRYSFPSSMTVISGHAPSLKGNDPPSPSDT